MTMRSVLDIRQLRRWLYYITEVLTPTIILILTAILMIDLKTREWTFDYSVPVDEWVYLTLVATNTDTKVYENGVLQDTVNTSIPLPLRAMGRNAFGMKAKLDEMKIWDSALNVELIEAFYDSYQDPNFEHLAHRWNFDVVSSTKAVVDTGRIPNIDNVVGSVRDKDGVLGAALAFDGDDYLSTAAYRSKQPTVGRLRCG